MKLDLAQFEELQAFAQFGSDLDAATKAKLERGRRIVELFKQGQYEPKPLGIEVINLYAIQKGFLDKVTVDDIRTVRARMEEEAVTTSPACVSMMGRAVSEPPLRPPSELMRAARSRRRLCR